MAKARHQHEHERINRREYPGTRQLCVRCETPTGRCEEDAIYDYSNGIDDPHGPLCEECFDELNGDAPNA
mgnify:CR=1 FL=1